MRPQNACAVVYAFVLWLNPGIIAAADGESPEATFQRICASCHGADPAPRAMTREAMSDLSPERILAALSSGIMSLFVLPFTADERAGLAAHISAREWAEPAPAATGESRARCATGALLDATAWNRPYWSGWSPDLGNSRRQRADHALLGAADAADLELRWAFGFAGAATVGTQPAVVGGRLFIGSPEHALYALDAKTGCTHWRFDTHGAIRGVPVVVPMASGPTLFTADRAGWVYAVDANTGALKWAYAADPHPATMVTASPVFHGGRLYVVTSSLEETSAWARDYECCTFRGSVTALDAASGARVWKTYVVTEPLRATGRSPYGTRTFGPSGAGIWSAPTIDPDRRLLFVTTGDGNSHPAPAASDAVVALDLDSGTVRWVWQATADDAYTNACVDPDVHPDILARCGPDLDFGASAILRTLPGGEAVLLAGQKSGVLHALDPANGRLRWQLRLSPGGVLGGIEWGMSADDESVYVPISDVWENLNRHGTAGGIVAVDFATATKRWAQRAPPVTCSATPGCVAGQPQAATLIPGLVFSGSMDGHMRIYRTQDGTVVWDYDTNREYETVNGIRAKGGSLNAGGATVVDGWVYFTSGYGLFGMPGNVLLAFSPSSAASQSRR